MRLGETRLALEDGSPELVEVLGRRLARRGEVIGDRGVDGIELTARVELREGLHGCSIV